MVIVLLSARLRQVGRYKILDDSPGDAEPNSRTGTRRRPGQIERECPSSRAIGPTATAYERVKRVIGASTISVDLA